MPGLVVIFANGSTSQSLHPDMPAAYEAASRVSTSGGKVARIEIQTSDGRRALWDSTWTPESNRAAMICPA